MTTTDGTTPADSTLRAILDLARWAPSGDNTQPWRFETPSPRRVIVHGFDTRDHCVYDLDGRPSQVSLGALLETVSIAARWHGLEAHAARRVDSPDTHPCFVIDFQDTTQAPEEHLVKAIPQRSVYRFGLSTKPLLAEHKCALEACMPAGYRLLWRESLLEKWRMALLLFRNARLRLTMEEAFEVHRSVIDWGQRYSPEKIPDQALGTDAATLKLMRWAMQDWQRVRFMNRWLAGTWAPRLQMDLLPALRCAAHFAIVSDAAPTTIDDYVAAGRVVQRLWLTACHLGLQHQPAVTPLVFARFSREGRTFSRDPQALLQAHQLQQSTATALPEVPTEHIVWLGRLGYGQAWHSRSQRLSPAALAHQPSQATAYRPPSDYAVSAKLTAAPQSHTDTHPSH